MPATLGEGQVFATLVAAKDRMGRERAGRLGVEILLICKTSKRCNGEEGTCSLSF